MVQDKSSVLAKVVSSQKCSKRVEDEVRLEFKSALNASDARFSLTMDANNFISLEEKETQTDFGATLTNNVRFEALEQKMNNFSRVWHSLDQVERRSEARDKELDNLKKRLDCFDI